MAHFTQQFPWTSTVRPETAVSTQDLIASVTVFVGEIPARIGIGEILRPYEAKRIRGYSNIPDEVLRRAMACGLSRYPQFIHSGPIEDHLKEVSRLQSVSRLLDEVELLSRRLKDHLARSREPAAREAGAFYAHLQAELRVSQTAQLEHDLEVLAEVLPGAGPQPARAEVVLPPVK